MKTGEKSDLQRNLEASAQSAGLYYVHDDQPGIGRRRWGRGFRFFDPEGNPIRDSETLQRLRNMVIPPAWRDVWICPSPRGHLQVTGRDDRGRKQYLYHSDWTCLRNEVKFKHILEFARILPELRRRVSNDLARRSLRRERILAAVVRLLERSLIRVGNESYMRENRSFGLTTLRHRHVEIDASEIRFSFRGKSGKWNEVSLHDRRVSRVLRRMLDLPGQELFRFRDDEGSLHTVASEDVNVYLREISGGDFTAKDIRTWHATVAAAGALREMGVFRTSQEGKKNVTQAMREAAARLGNRPAACRKYYVHPAIPEAYLDGTLLPALQSILERIDDSSPPEMDKMETAIQDFLRRRRAKSPA